MRGGVKAMETKDLFRVALGLGEPWQVVKIEFSPEGNQLDLWLDFPRGGTFACPVCGRVDCGVYDTAERKWRHLNFFQYKTLLHARQPRIECPDHGVKTVEVPWARRGVGFTVLMEAFILALVQNGMTPNQVGRMIGEYDTRVWRVLQHYVEQARDEADFSEVTAIGVDETSRKRGHNYISVFMDLDESRVLFVTEGRDAATVEAFREDLEAHGGQAEQIAEACLDMSPSYISGLESQFPTTELTFDQFHLMKIVNEAVDEVRRAERADRPELKGTRYVWLKNQRNHTAKQSELFAALRNGSLKTARACHIKTVFQDIFGCQSVEEAEPMLKAWYFWATHSRLEPMIAAAKTIKRHWNGVLRWFTSRITNGMLEGINSLIQAAKARARGFRSVDYLITMIYLLVGKLDFQLPAVIPVTHTK
jgi:transposase